MKRWYLFLSISIVIVLVLTGLYYFVFKQKVGDVQPSLMPPTKDLATIIEKNETQKTGDAPTMPLKLPVNFHIGVFAKGVAGARDLAFSPGGTLVVSQPGSGTVTALPDRDSDGHSDAVKMVATGLSKPHGLAFYGDKLLIAENTRLSRYSWDESNSTARLDKVLMSLPTGGHDSHTVAVDENGRVFVKIGSSCNVCTETNSQRATVVVTDMEGSNPVVYADGLRNAAFIIFDPADKILYGSENGRDNLGDELPPDEIDAISENGNYGWPICYGNKVHDTNFDKKNYFVDPCQSTVAPAFAVPAHSAPLGMAFVPKDSQFPSEMQGSLLVSYHGSWNRSVPTGYKVVLVHRENGTFTAAEDFLTGFLDRTSALGRPVDLVFDQKGSLYISDDKAGNVYKVIYEK